MAELLPGAPVAERLTQDLKARSDALRQRGGRQHIDTL